MQKLESSPTVSVYRPADFYSFPFTLVASPKKWLLSRPTPLPFQFEVYCVLSCKKVKIGFSRNSFKEKEAIQFNTTSWRWVQVHGSDIIKYTVNKHPPNKKDKKKLQGEGWYPLLQVLDKGNMAIFNPYYIAAGDPLSLYTYNSLSKFNPSLPQLSYIDLHPIDPTSSLIINGLPLYLLQNADNSITISHRKWFGQSSVVRVYHPDDSSKGLEMEAVMLKEAIEAHKTYWLYQLQFHSMIESNPAALPPTHSLSQIYINLTRILNLDEQLYAALHNSQTHALLQKLYGSHPRLFTEFGRLKSFIGYGRSQFNTKKLAELGFYNKSDILQDLAFIQYPQIPIPSAEQPLYSSEEALRSKCFPFARLTRNLPFPNIPLKVTIESLAPQQLSASPIKITSISGPYAAFLNANKQLSVWSCRQFALKLFQLELGQQINSQTAQKIYLDDSQIAKADIKEGQVNLLSLFDEGDSKDKEPPKDQKPVQVVPDPAMLQQMINMGYGVAMAKKALLAVKNESIPAAIDAIEQITSEEKKKIKEKKIKKEWNCPSCTFANKGDAQMCQICGEIPNFLEQEENQRQRLEKEEEKRKAEQELKAKQLAEEQKLKADLLKQQEAQAKLKLQKQRQESLKQSQIIDLKLYIHKESPIDPFFIIFLSHNSKTNKSYLRAIRIGLSRLHLFRFYRLEQQYFVSNFSGKIFPKTYAGLQQLIKESEWKVQHGLAILQGFKGDQYRVLSSIQVELNGIQCKQIQIKGNAIFCGQKTYEVSTKDDFQKTSFQLKSIDKIEKKQEEPRAVQIIKQEQKIDASTTVEQRVIKAGESISLDFSVSSIQIQVIQDLPIGQFKLSSNALKTEQVPPQPQAPADNQIAYNEFIPLSIQHHQGSVFSGKHYPTSILERSSLYISNYPNTNFTFKHIAAKDIIAQKIVIISSSKRLQKIYPIYQGLIFTANELGWFHLAKEKFANFSQHDYLAWSANHQQKRQFWEPVAFFKFENQCQFQLDYKRAAKYIFLLPTNIKNQAQKKEEVYAVKIDFFGVKGSVEEKPTGSALSSKYKSDGNSGCIVSLKDKEGKQLVGDPSVVVHRACGVDSYKFLPKTLQFTQICPLSTTTFFQIKLKQRQQSQISLSISSQYASSITLRINHDKIDTTISQNQITNYKQLANAHQQLGIHQLKHIISRLDINQIVQLMLAGEGLTKYETLLKKIQEVTGFKEKLLQAMTNLMPRLCQQSIVVTQHGLKAYLSMYQKLCTISLSHSFISFSTTLKNIISTIQQTRNKSYPLLRSKYNIEELVLEPYLFSKDYYRMIHPTYIQEKKQKTIAQIKGNMQLQMGITMRSPFSYTSLIDLTTIKQITDIKLYFNKIVSASRLKVSITLSAVDDSGSQQFYSRYFHEDFLVQMGIYAYKETELFQSGYHLNSISIPILTEISTRYIKMEVNYLLGTLLPHNRFKQSAENAIILMLVDGKEVIQGKNQCSSSSFSMTEKAFNSSFDFQAKNTVVQEKIPPYKFSQQQNKSIYQVYAFPVLQPQVIHKQFTQTIDKITTNILDAAIVDQCIKSIHLSHYTFNKKGLDFYYTLLINLMASFPKKYPQQYHINVQLMLNIFDTLVVYEIGPIMKKSMAFLLQMYKRVTPLQKGLFVDGVVEKYIAGGQHMKEMKIADKYSLAKVVEKLKQLDLPSGNLFSKLSNHPSLLVRLTIPSLLLHNLSTCSLSHPELYLHHKFIRNITGFQLINISFSHCLWVLDNVGAVKEQAMAQGLELLLWVMENEAKEGIKEFMSKQPYEDIWKLVFLTLKLKSQPLKDKLHKFFTILISNITPSFLKSINSMLHQIITKPPQSLYMQLNSINSGVLSDELWMNHLQTTLELISMTKNQIYLQMDISLRLLQLPLTTGLWKLVLHIIPRKDQILISIIQNFKKEYYNSLGKEITKFCQPLAGIRSIDSLHINWLDLVRKIRLEGKNIFQLFVEELEKTSFGGREGVTMATFNEVKQLEITCEFVKLLLEKEKEIKSYQLTENNLKTIILWYFLNKTTQKGTSPASDKLLFLSQQIKLLFTKISTHPQISPLCISLLLRIRAQSETIERMFMQKRIPIHSALTLNNRFCNCFQELLHVFMTTDELSGYFAFEAGGLQYILRTIDVQNKGKEEGERDKEKMIVADEQMMISEGLIPSKLSKQPAGAKQASIKQLQDLKEEQFATNIKLVPLLNVPNLTCTVTDWTVNKKGNKTKVIYLPLTQTAYNEHSLYLQLAKTVEIRSIKIGFPAASYQFSDKLIVSPSSVVIEGSADCTNFQPIGEMEYLPDDGYLSIGVKVYILNCQKTRQLGSISESLKDVVVHRVKYLKINIKRPIVTILQGQYSTLNAKPYNNLGCSISFLSVTGDDAEKLPFALIQSCKQISKKSSLALLSNLLSEVNPTTTSRISNDQHFSSKIQQNFTKIQQYLQKYPQTMPNVVQLIGAGNKPMGDWIIAYFLKEGSGQIEAKICNQIIVSTPEKMYQRISIYLSSLMSKISTINKQPQIQSGLLYTKCVPFIQSFCKTLEECYQLGFSSGQQLQCTLTDIHNIIAIYDKKSSSPQIKSLIKLLVYLIYVREPLSLQEEVREKSMDEVWSSCSDAKSHFYGLMGALLVDRKAKEWIQRNNYDKITILVEQINKSIASSSFKTLKLQLFLLCQISYHESSHLKSLGLHLHLYNSLKHFSFPDFQIYEYLLRILRNVILNDEKEEELMAKTLKEDVALLVKRRDPMLQKMYVGVLGMQQQVMINVIGVDVKDCKKQQTIPSKYLTAKTNKLLLEKIGKKYKYHPIGKLTTQIKPEHQSLFLKSFTSPSLLIMRFSVDSVQYTCGIFSPAASKRNEQDTYYWEEVINYGQNGMIWLLGDGEQLWIKGNSKNAENGQVLLGNMYGGDEQQQNCATYYDNGEQIIKISFGEHGSKQNVPKINFTKYQKEFPAGKNVLDFGNQQYSFIGLQFFQLKPHALLPIDSKLSSLLSKSNQAKAPFSFYRHLPIYIFPAKITISKLLNILGINGQCRVKGTAIAQEEVLSELQAKSQDFIVDLQVIRSESKKEDENEVNEIGYIPIMNIFNHFSSMDGVSQVLRLGSQSIKDWKNADRKKNFEHYLDQLRSFVPLPNFFNLFIKNHTHVTFLFEVAAGLPDDPASTRNWQQQYLISFRFMYKIVSDIFKLNRSKELRDMDKYSDFVQVILQKLSEISKEKSRQLKEDEEQQTKQQQIGAIQKKKSEQKQKRKKKGTGYGADNQNNSKWSSSEWLQNKKNTSQQILRVAAILVSFLDCETPLADDRISQILKQSCLLPLLESALRSGSLLDISKESQLFKTYLQIIRLLSVHPATIQCVLDLQKKYKPVQTESIFTLLLKLNGIAQIFTECLKSGKQSKEDNQTAEGISLDIQKTYHIVDKAVKTMKKKTKVLTIKELNEMPLAQAYRHLLSNYRFGYVNLKEGNVYKHAHSASITPNSHPSTQKILRLSQQLADLSSSLPCEHTNSIFVRCDRSRIDVINVLICGSKDTPYSNGAFTFDVYCDDSYPNNPPKMLITTTGQGKIRFNPNLYSCGKVCLSLLGTWRGSASQNWDPKLSTLLQLFISTQGITMSDDIYFNQPGFEGEQGTDEGERKNEAYSNIVRLGNIRYAMIGQIKSPPKGFQQVIHRHFYIKRKEILQECQKWIQYAQKREASYNGLVHDHNNSWCTQLKASKTKYKEMLVKQVDELRELLNNMAPPDLKEKEEKMEEFNEKAKPKEKAVANEIKLEEVDVQYETTQKQAKQYEEHVIQDRWSRYIGAMGIQAVKKQSQSTVLLIGLKPLGLEIAKNLVLSGLKKLTIVEQSQSTNHSEHFYMANLKSKQIKDCIFKIKELNPYMTVDHSQSIPTDLSIYSIVICTEGLEYARQISQNCRKANVKFIYTQTVGVSGNYFADFGPEFLVNDNNGEQPFEGIIKSISNDEKGIVSLLEGVKHPYQDGDYIVLQKVEGMELKEEKIQQKSEEQLFYEKLVNQKSEGINGKVFKIKVINWNSFSIGDTSNYTQYLGSGLCKNIKIPRKIQFKSLHECEQQFEKHLDSNLALYDFEKMGDNQNTFICYQALAQFRKINKHSPLNWNIQEAEQFAKIAEEIAKPLNKNEQDLKKFIEFVKKFAYISEAQLPTIGAYLGGLVAQEVIKGITNKYYPIKQFFTFHLNQLALPIPQHVQEIQKLAVPKEQPFRNLKIVVGKENMKKIEEIKAFVIGAGAIGCQLLKNFAMVNMGAKGQIVVTDPDHIQTSNLSRQFLFREKHVKKAKSATACATLLQLNPNLQSHISARLDKVCQQSQQIYTNQFFKSRTIVANALDNVKARQYVDKRCVQNKIPLFESGTLGPKGHVQVIVPDKTQNYGSQNDPNEQAAIPHCTLKMFPEQTVHCIEWARDIFGKIFTLNPKALKKVIQTKNLNSLQGQEKETVCKMIKYRPINFDDCIAEAVRKFYICFRNNVRQLLFTYPIDMKTKEGRPFWQLPKRPPKQINYLDKTDEVIKTFISSYAVLLAKIYNLPYPQNFRKQEGKDKIMEIAVQVKVQQFVPNEENSKQIQKEVQKEKKKEEFVQEQIVQKPIAPKQNLQDVKLTPQILQLQIKPQQFEKDEDANGHIDLIYSMSSLRCRNYSLNDCTWIEAKLKAGKIMAALSTTTSVVAALQTLEIIKLATGCTSWRSAFINLAVPLIQISQPGPAPKFKIGSSTFTVWDHWEFKCATLKEFLTQLQQKYEVEGYNISSLDGKPIYWQAMYKEKEQAREQLLNKNLKELLGSGQSQVHVLMRDKQGKNYENVPKVILRIE